MSLFHLNYLIFQKYDKKKLERIALATSWEEQLEYVYYRALLLHKVLIHGYAHAISFFNMGSYFLDVVTSIQLIIGVLYILLSFAAGEPILPTGTECGIPLFFTTVETTPSNSYCMWYPIVFSSRTAHSFGIYHCSPFHIQLLLRLDSDRLCISGLRISSHCYNCCIDGE